MTAPIKPPEGSISLYEFAERLGLKDASAVQGVKKFKYEKYITRINGGTGKGNVFVTEVDYSQYLKDEEKKRNIIALCGLFTEYLNKELMIKYIDIARFVSEHTKYKHRSLNQTIASMEYSYNVAYAVTSTFKKFDNEKIKKFDDYYGWNEL